MLEEEAQHFSARIRPAGVGVRALGAAARPCVRRPCTVQCSATTRPSAASRCDAARRGARAVAVATCWISTVTRVPDAGCDDLFAIARMHGRVGVAMEDDGRHAAGSTAGEGTAALHRHQRSGQVGCRRRPPGRSGRRRPRTGRDTPRRGSRPSRRRPTARRRTRAADRSRVAPSPRASCRPAAPARRGRAADGCA